LLPLAYLVVTLLLIDATESLATIAAVDNIDPYRRRSDPDRTLLAMGVSTRLEPAGWLDHHPRHGQEHGECHGRRPDPVGQLLQRLLPTDFRAVRPLRDRHGPMAVLAAILVFIGYKLCKPALWRKIARVGTEQLVVFCTTCSSP